MYPQIRLKRESDFKFLKDKYHLGQDDREEDDMQLKIPYDKMEDHVLSDFSIGSS